MEEADVLKKLILQKLVRANIWGGKHKFATSTIGPSNS